MNRYHNRSRILGATFFVTATTTTAAAAVAASPGFPPPLRSPSERGQGRHGEGSIRGRVDVLRTPDPRNPRQPSFFPFLLATPADGSAAATQSDYCLAADVSDWVRGRVGSFYRTSSSNGMLGPALSLLTSVDDLGGGGSGHHSVNVSQPFIVFNVGNAIMGSRCNRWHYQAF